VKRSTTAGGPYATIATNLATLSYEDTNTSANTLYYYVVSATDNGLESVNSSESSASMSAAPGTSWLSQDVGAVGAAGAFSQSSGTFTVNGSGADIWYGADEFRYVFQAVRGNYLFTARVLNMQNTANWAKAGIMMRETLNADSKCLVNFMSPANGVALQQRTATGASAAGVSGTSGLAAPYWVRLVRSGSTFAGYSSADATNWTALGTTTVAMLDDIYLGLAVCSVNRNALPGAVRQREHQRAANCAYAGNAHVRCGKRDDRSHLASR
jgi:regulation of enolase protein 1 (concanavalin A-like superfamily)